MKYEKAAAVFGALSEPLRLRLAREVLNRGQVCGKDLSAALDVSLALVCHHAKILTEAGLLKKKKIGQSTVYSYDGTPLEEALKSLPRAES
jgi:Predicted transcriptional regulators